MLKIQLIEDNIDEGIYTCSLNKIKFRLNLSDSIIQKQNNIKKYNLYTLSKRV